MPDVENLPPPANHTDALLARLGSRLFAGQSIEPEEFTGLQPAMRGDIGSVNMKLEGATLAYFWEAVDPGPRLLLDTTRQRLLTLLDYQLNVGMWTVPGPNGPVAEFQSPSHAKHHLRWMAECLHAAREIQDEEVLTRIRIIWRQVLHLARLTATNDGEVLVAGPRATRRLNKEKQVDLRRKGTDVGLDATYREVFRLELRPPARKLEGDDMLGPRIVRHLRDEGEATFEAATYGAVAQTRQENLPLTVVPLAIGRAEHGGGAVWVEGPCPSSDPGPQYWAMSTPQKLEFGVEPANATPEIGFFPYTDHFRDPRNMTWAATWRTRTSGAFPRENPPSVPPPAAPPVEIVQGISPADLRELANSFIAGARRLNDAADAMERSR